MVPQEFPDSEEANANCDDSSEVQDAVLNLRVDILVDKSKFQKSDLLCHFSCIVVAFCSFPDPEIN